MTRAQRNKSRRKKDRSLESSRFATKIRKENDKTLLTSTGKFCYQLKIAYRPRIFTGVNAQFFGRTRENF
tara:strand:+ start:1132 stop:1341 length:210 start_codon:yes stop_codon:yes gene_type:complete